ncbi:MAG: WxL domain-containing protein [Enterococcus casseliflavus]
MTKKLRRSLYVLGMIMLIIQALFIPIGMINAETTTDREGQKKVEQPQEKNYLEAEQSNDSHFFFTSSRIHGTVQELLEVSFFSNQEVHKARVFLPAEAILLKDQLPAGISIEQGEGEYPREWIVKSKRAQNTFVLPLLFEEAGKYELSLEEATVHLEISEQVQTSEASSLKETKSSVEDLSGQEVLKEEHQNDVQSEEEELESVEETSQQQKSDVEKTDKEPQRIESKVFDGETVEVTTMAEFSRAVANPDIGVISVQANLTGSTTNILKVDRPLFIQGNGYTMTFGINGFYFQLEEVTQASTLRIENATLTKVGVTPLINATIESSKNWVVEIEDITEVNANTMRLASLPQGSIHFTGGVSNFIRTTSVQTFIEAKEIVATNQAEVTISRGNAMIFFSSAATSNPKVMVQHGAKVTITTTVAGNNTIDLRGESPELILQSSGELSITTGGTTATPTNTTNNAIALNGSTPKVSLNTESILSIATTGSKRGMFLSGHNGGIYLNNSQLSVISHTTAGAFINGDNSTISLNGSRANFLTTSGRSIFIQGNDALLSMTSSELYSSSTGNMTSENILIGSNNLRPKLIIHNQSKLITTSTSSNNSPSISNSQINLSGINPTVVVSDNSEIDIYTTANLRNGLVLTGADSNFEVSSSKINIKTTSGQSLRLEGDMPRSVFKDGSEVDIYSTSSSAFFVSGRNSEITISDSDTNVKLSSHIYADEGNATLIVETPSRLEDAGELLVNNNATLEVESNQSTAINITSLGYTFDISNGTLKAQSNSSEGDHAVIRFLYYGLAKFMVRENGNLDINKTGGSAPLLRIPSGGNSFEVSGGGDVNFYNPGNGIASDGLVAGGNQAIYYARGINTNGITNDFSVIGRDSRFKAVTDNGPAIVMDSFFRSNINVENGYLDVEGKTSSSSNGIFQAGEIEVDINNPIFFDFRNTRAGGGNIFSVSDSSVLTGTNSDLAVWRNDADLDNDPDLNFRSIDYVFSGRNFKNLSGTSDPDKLNTDIFGNNGLTDYTRMSSNNGRWAIADELRVPTNADKKINGRVSLPVGLDGSRPAWDEEAMVTIEVESPSGDHTQEYIAKTVGDTYESPGISIYGEEPRGGLFEIDLNEPLEAGSKVRIIKVELTSGELTDGFEHQILTDTVTVFPVIPPTPAQFSSSIIAQDSTTIQGMTDNLDVEVTATHNGEPINTEGVSVDTEGRFRLNLSDIDLEIADKIQVFLRDNEGSAQQAGVINPPETNNTRGNINPPIELMFHDVTFEPVTTLIVGDVGPVSPVDPLNPDIDVDPENRPELPMDQGQLSIDFISSFNFGSHAISAQNRTYYAYPQRLLNEDGSVNESEERPNYVQISDRRPENERNGWELAVTQKEQFKGEENQVLNGASLSLLNQQVITAQDGLVPGLQSVLGNLVPGNRLTLLRAQGNEGTGTFIYRFGDEETAGESIALDVPRGANPEATIYSTTLLWELSVVPDN